MKERLRFLGFTHGETMPALQQVNGASQSPYLDAGTNVDSTGQAQTSTGALSQPDNDREADHSKCCLLLTPKTHWLSQARCQTYVSICSEFDTQFSLVKYLTAATCSSPPQPPCLSDTATPTQLCLYLEVPIS